jgi:hypothetical protein
MSKNPGKIRMRADTLQNFAHFALGFSILMKAVSKIEDFHHHPLSISFIFLAGAFVIAGAAFRHRIEPRFKKFASVFHIAEGLVLVTVGLILLDKGKVRLPWFYFFAGVMLVVLGLADWFTPEGKHDKVFAFLTRLFGLFLSFGAAVVFLLNLFRIPDLWMNVIGAVFAVMGFVLVFFVPRLQKSNRRVD